MTKARDLANIISGGFDATDIPNLDTAKITSGTFADARLPATALNSNVDLTTLSASNLTSGTVPTARLGSGTADATTFLRGDGSFATPVGGTNTPSFEARLSSDQTISDDTFTKINVNEEVFDTDNCYDNSTNYRFTPTVAGKYFVYWVVCGQANSANAHNSNSFIYFNGSQYNGANIIPNGNSAGGSTTATAIINFNGSSDYVEFYLKIDAVSGTVKADHDFNGGNTTYAGAYKLIG